MFFYLPQSTIFDEDLHVFEAALRIEGVLTKVPACLPEGEGEGEPFGKALGAERHQSQQRKSFQMNVS